MRKAQTGSKGCEQGDEEGAGGQTVSGEILGGRERPSDRGQTGEKEDQYVIHLDAEPEPTVTMTEE